MYSESWYLKPAVRAFSGKNQFKVDLRWELVTGIYIFFLKIIFALLKNDILTLGLLGMYFQTKSKEKFLKLELFLFTKKTNVPTSVFISLSFLF